MALPGAAHATSFANINAKHLQRMFSNSLLRESHHSAVDSVDDTDSVDVFNS